MVALVLAALVAVAIGGGGVAVTRWAGRDERRGGRLQVGSTVPVLVDPGDRDHVELDLDRAH